MPKKTDSAKNSEETLSITYVNIDQLKEWPGNPREHDIGEIYNGIKENGF